VKIVEGDVLRIRLPIFDKVVASPPYNISSKLIFSLLRRKLKSMTMVLQKEFALRLVADPGSAEYGRLTVALRHKANTHLLDFVPRTVFRPIPRVDSHIVRIIPKGDITSVNESFFGQTVRYLFSQRKRILRGVLKRAANTSLGEPLDSFVETADLLEKRIFQLTTHEFEILSNYLYPRRKLFKLVTT